MKLNQDHLDILRNIEKSSKVTQRELAVKSGLSLGKLNYCLKELKKKGYVKIKNFEKNQNKKKYLYILTPIGIKQKTILLVNFMKRKMNEYDELKEELNKIKKKKINEFF
jgi:EPS-associated MarR family transcriptional regulator